MIKYRFIPLVLILILVATCSREEAARYEPVQDPDSRLSRVLYNNPGLEVDLGVGLWAWPMPLDYDGDGDMDLVVGCTDKPFNGAYLFENPDGEVKMPVFLPPVKIGEGKKNVLVCCCTELEKMSLSGPMHR